MPNGDQPLDIFIRPQRVRLLAAAGEAPGRNRLAGTVAGEVFVGDRLEVLVQTAAGRVTVESPSGGEVPAVGTAVMLDWAIEDTLLFPRAA